MSNPLDYSNVGKEVVITGVTFGEGVMEIQFMELRDQANEAGLMKVLVVKTTNYLDHFNNITEELQDIIDKGLLEIRNPEVSFDPRRRLAAQKPTDPYPNETEG